MTSRGTSRFAQVRLWVAAHAAELGAPASVESLCSTALTRLGMSGAALTTDGPGGWPEAVHATALRSARLAELQVTVGEGPCIDARREGGPVLAADLASVAGQRRWPLFAPLAVEAGAGALFAFPLRVGAISVGVLAFDRVEAGQLGPAELPEALAFAMLAMVMLLDEQAGLPAADGDVDDHDGAPFLPPHVHQSTGMIAAQIDGDIADAFARLRARAFADRRPLHELAADIVARKVRFDPESEGK
jgi:hypothetical protein